MADRTDLDEGDQPDTETIAESAPESADFPRRRKARRAALATGGVLVLALLGAWLARERIASHVIDGQLAALGLPATYQIESIGPGVEVLRNIVVGDPAKPDLTIDRAEVHLAYGLGMPFIGSVRVVKPRVYGHYVNDRVSFGTLDKVVYAPSDPAKPFRLPALDLSLVDARGLIDSPYGRLAFRADGNGGLRDGFVGTLAAVVPQARVGDCKAGRASLYGKVSISGERPAFAGPLRTAGLACDSAGLAMDAADLQIDARADKDLKGGVAKGKLRSGEIRSGNAGAESLALDTALVWRGGGLSGRIAANAGGVHGDGGTIALLALDGRVLARDAVSRLEFRGALDGQGLRRGPAFDRALASAQDGSEGTLIAPMVAQVRAALAREERGSRVGGDLTFRKNGAAWSVVVPAMTLHGGSGAALVSLSRVQVAGDGERTPRLAGGFATGGPGLPLVTGRMEQAGRSGATFRLAMAPYRAGDGELSVPDMIVAQVPDGSLGFSGMARLSGAIPGGSVRNLMLPVQGAVGGGGELALYRRCFSPSFDALVLGQVALDARTLTICPVAGQAIVRQGVGGLRVAAGVSSLSLSGKLGETPLRLESGAVGFAWPGTLTARAVDVGLGPDGTAIRLKLADLVARLGKDFSGTFGGVDARLGAVPLDVTNAAGQWRYAGQKLLLTDVDFDVTDRNETPRFEKLAGKGATLTLFDNQIDANAGLYTGKDGQEVVRVTVRHDLGDASGHADLAVAGLKFEDRKDGSGLQPADVTKLALGLVANAQGTVKGAGHIDWTARGVTSRGKFSTGGMDLAAAFGPVKGLSGALEFTDLLGMVTAPHQQLSIASVNPGIEVADGRVDIQLLPDQVLRLNSAVWPFLGGKLSLQPTDLRLGLVEARRYTLVIEGLDAARFLERMEMSNLSATGTFDGQMPLVFDADGGRLEDGALVSRPPGGSVSYVGALSYKDLSSMANFAFDALKSMNYKTMTIAMKGDLEGEIVTNVKFGGVKQGAGTRQNFLTRKVANLPIQFNVNVRAPFYQLITSMKAMYDPASVKDPRVLGLVDARGRSLRTPGVSRASLPASVATIQQPDSAGVP
jgi:hypothetical protein